jgi:hypothetical protein
MNNNTKRMLFCVDAILGIISIIAFFVLLMLTQIIYKNILSLMEIIPIFKDTVDINFFIIKNLFTLLYTFFVISSPLVLYYFLGNAIMTKIEKN